MYFISYCGISIVLSIQKQIVMTVNSPYSGKAMQVVYEEDLWEFRGEKYPYIHIAFRDNDKDEQFTTTESDTACYEQVTNQYRAKYGVPYTDEITALRERYGLSATKMSLILGFGVNQYRLYELGEVPSESNGKMIRGAMNPRVFLDLVDSSKNQLSEKEFEKITARVLEVIGKSGFWQSERRAIEQLFLCGRGEKNGFAPQSTVRLKNLLLYILGKMGDTCQSKMNIVLFYIDFLSFRNRGMAISGLSYNTCEYGPVPIRWNRIYSAFEEVESIIRLDNNQESIFLKACCEADLGCFSEQEKEIIDFVCDKLKGESVQDIFKMCISEPVWQKYLHQNKFIPFTEAFALQAM